MLEKLNLQYKIKNLQIQIHRNAVTKKFWNKDQDISIYHEATVIALIGSEVNEAIEAHRNGNMENLKEELADIVIRTLDVAEHFDFNLMEAVHDKMIINKQRPNKHNKRY